jgi:hypothetical protein
MTFRTSLDGLAKGITIGVIILFSVIIGGQLIPSIGLDPIKSLLLIGLLIGICLFCVLFRPLNYILTSEKLVIHRLFSDITIKRQDILTAREISNNDMGLTIRTFGVGGLFGYFGKFFNSKIGRLTMYGTRRNNTVLIETDNKKIILTPDDPIEFLRQLLIR